MNIEEAKVFAQNAHRGQVDDSGNDYFKAHVEQVVEILKQVCNDDSLLAAAYLHDTVEDCGVKYEELLGKFGKDVAGLVMEVTHEGKKDEKGYYFPRLQSRRAIMLKFADRLSNLSRLSAWPADRQAQYLRRSKFWRSE